MSNSDIKIAIVVSTYNAHITDRLLEGALQVLKPVLPDEQITVVSVPGAVEIPFAAQQLAKTKQYDAIIVYGAVIYGETDHYHYVCEQVSYGCQRVMLDEQVPVIFGVLTTRTLEQAQARSGGAKGNIGAEYAHTALKMIALQRKIAQMPRRVVPISI